MDWYKNMNMQNKWLLKNEIKRRKKKQRTGLPGLSTPVPIPSE